MDVHQNYFNIAVCLKHFIIKYWEGKITVTQNLYTQIWTAVSFLIPMNWKQAHYSPGSEFLAKLSSSYTMEYHSAIKRTEYWYTEQPGWIWRELTWVKKATSQRLYTLRFHLYKILKKEKKIEKKEQMSGCQRFRMRREKEVNMVVKGNTKDPWSFSTLTVVVDTWACMWENHTEV